MKVSKFLLFFLSLSVSAALFSCSDPLELGRGINEAELPTQRAKFTGIWNYSATLNSNSSIVQMATVEIEIDPFSENGLRLYNFANLGTDAFTVAHISEDGQQLSITNQKVGGSIISGLGTFMTSVGRVDFNIKINQEAYNVSLLKQ